MIWTLRAEQAIVSNIPTLPPGYHFRALLSAWGAGCVLLVEVEGQGGPEKLVMRVDLAPGSSEAAAELEVLAAIEHPALVPLSDFGVLPEGGRFVCRPYLKGRELGELWRDSGEPARVAELLLELLEALAALHEAGFAHGDLKPSNVLVDETGRLRLVDFGLARAVHPGEQGPAAGSLYFAAPEVLLGLPASPTSDLFSLGVLAHELTGGERPPADAFYAEFPRRSFLDVVGGAGPGLPSHLATWLARLLATDPSERFATAREAARELADRAGLEAPPSGPPTCPTLPLLRGLPLREDWLETVLEELTEEHAALWFDAPPGEDLEGLSLSILLGASRSGLAVDALDLEAEAERHKDAYSLDLALSTWLASTSRPKLIHLCRGDAWTERALALLVRTWQQLEAHEHATLAVLTTGAAEASLGEAWQTLTLPRLGVSEVRDRLGAALEAGAAELDELTQLLEGVESVTALNSRLAELAARGVLVAGERLPRLRAGASAVLLEQSQEASSGVHDLDRAALHLLGLALVSERGIGRGDLTSKALAQSARELIAAGLVVQARGALRASSSGAALLRQLGDATRMQAAHLAASESAAACGETGEAALQAIAAGRMAALEVCVREWAQLRDAGQPERVLAASRRLTDFLAMQGRGLPAELLAEDGLAELASGLLERAQARVDELEALADAKDDPRALALAMRLRGRLLELRHLPEEAESAFSRALALDPAAAGEVAVARANLWYATGKHGRVLELASSLDGAEGVSLRQADYVRSVAAMVKHAGGDARAAITSLTSLLERAVELGDRQRQAALSVNLATVLRRTGELERALELNREAVAAYRAVGHLPGLALAQNQLGGLLRETGQLALAQEQLSLAADLRGRLGDRGGRAVVRGTLALLLAERGHLSRAIEECEAAQADLGSSQRAQFGPLLAAHAALLSARAGRSADGGELEDSDQPRILLALGRAAALDARPEVAMRLLRRAIDAAEEKQAPRVRAEAAFVLAYGLGSPAVATPIEGEEHAPLVAEDRRVLAFVLAGPDEFDADAARALASDLVARGRDDRALRLWLAILRTDPAAEAEVRRLLDRLDAGLTAAEASVAHRALFGFPDPRPNDLDRFEAGAQPEELEMEVLRLLEINQRLVAQEDLGELLGTIVEEALAVSTAERGYLILEEDGVLRLDTARDSSRGGVDEPDIEVSGSAVGRALQEMAPLRISDATVDPELGAAQSVRDLDLRSILCVPFRVDEHLRGVLYLDNRLRSGAFDERAERLANLLVGQAALAIGQVRRRKEIEALNTELAERIEVREADLEVAKRELAAAGLPAPVGGLVGRSPALAEVRNMIERAAPTELSVLVTGESGTGKELAARAIHDLSNRKDGPFVSENCAAMPPSLIEAELFGVVRGAFTGAELDRPGLFERAGGGTLFLDEVGEMPLELQAKLLRALETRRVRPVGGSDDIAVDFRLVTATNRDLAAEVAAERFRGDLYYRIRGLELSMPTLAEAAEDIPELFRHFLALEARRAGAEKALAPEVLAALVARPWPGNVRELRNEAQRLFALSGKVIDDPGLVRPPADLAPAGELDGTLREIEERAIRAALARTGGDRKAAAELLGISRSKIYQRIKEWGLGEASGLV